MANELEHPVAASEPVTKTAVQPMTHAQPVDFPQATKDPDVEAAAPDPGGKVEPQQATPAEAAGGQPASEYPVVEAITPDSDEEAEVQLALKSLEERRKRNRRKRIVKIVIACVIVAAAIAAWAIVNAVNAQKQKEEAEAAAALAAISMTEQPASGIQASGSLKPGSSTVVTPEVSGIIQEVRVTEGQHVTMGDVLYTLKSDEADKGLVDAQAAVDKAQRSVSKAQSDVSRAQQDYDDAVSSYNSAVDAYNDSIGTASAAGQAAFDKTYQQAVAAIPSSATAAERDLLLEEAELKADAAYAEAYQNALAADPGTFDHSAYAASLDAANDAVISAQEALDDAQRSYARAQELKDNCQVKAPRSGTVLSMKAVVGSSVGGASGGYATSSEATVVIGDLSTLEVDIEVNEIDVAGVKVGQSAEVTFPAFPDIQETAEVVSVAASATNSSSESTGSGGGIVTFTVKLVIKHPDNRLKAGMSANVRILTDDDAQAASTATSAGQAAEPSASAAATGSAS